MARRKTTASQKKAKTVKLSQVKHYFVNRGRVLALVVDFPEEIPAHKIKEVFDNEFVGKEEDLLESQDKIQGFAKLDENIQWKLLEMVKKD